MSYLLKSELVASFGTVEEFIGLNQGNCVDSKTELLLEVMSSSQKHCQILIFNWEGWELIKTVLLCSPSIDLHHKCLATMKEIVKSQTNTTKVPK